MSNRLPVFDVFRNSFRYMLEHYRILSLFCIFSFLGIYMLGGFNLADNLLGGAFYLLYTYLFYFIFVRVYFNRQKLFSKPEFINALVRIITISLLAFASLMLLETAVLFFLWLLNPLEIYPHIREMWTNFIASNTFRYALYGGMFLFLTVIFYIPALAWVSAVIGRNASITLTFFHTKDNYLRIFLICFRPIRGYCAPYSRPYSLLFSVLSTSIFMNSFIKSENINKKTQKENPPDGGFSFD